MAETWQVGMELKELLWSAGCPNANQIQDMVNSDCHLELWELLMGKQKLMCQQREAAQGMGADGERVAGVAAEPQAALPSSGSN